MAAIYDPKIGLSKFAKGALAGLISLLAWSLPIVANGVPAVRAVLAMTVSGAVIAALNWLKWKLRS